MPISAASLGIPKIIYSLWLQGADNAPETVRAVFRQWAALNPGYELRVLAREEVDALLGGSAVRYREMTAPALSDVVRSRLLLEGGVWVDASLFPSAPLDWWLPPLVAKSGFFAFEKPGEDRPLSSWFLAAAKEHILVSKWSREVERYWSKPRSQASYQGSHIPPDPVWEVAPNGGAVGNEFPYYWFHYLFRYLLETDPEFASRWHHCSKIAADPSHRLQELFAEGGRPSANAIIEAVRGAPVHKLDRRRSYPFDILGDAALASGGQFHRAAGEMGRR